MTGENLPILVILVLAVLGKNQSVAIATAFLLTVKLLGLDGWFPVLEDKGFSLGIIILTIAILVPVAAGRITLHHMVEAFTTPLGLAAIGAGVFAAWAAGQGAFFIKVSPHLVSSLVVGTVIGVCFLQGVAIGPLIAGGLVSLLATTLQIFSK